MSALAGQFALCVHCSDERYLADSGEMYSGIVVLGHVLAPALAQERQDEQASIPNHV